MSGTPEGDDRLPGTKVRRSRSLMAKLVATFLVLSIVMVGVVATLAAQRARDSLEESVYGRLDGAQELTGQSIVRWVEEQRRNLAFAAGLLRGVGGAEPGTGTDAVAQLLDPEVDAVPRLVAKKQVRQTLEYIVKETADASELFVLDPDGTIVASTTADHEGSDLGGEEFVKRGQSGQFVQPVGRSALTDGPTIIVSTPLFDADGMLRGVLAANLDLSRVDRIVLQKTGLGAGGQTYVVDSDNEFVHANLSGDSGQVHSTAIDQSLQQQQGRGLYLNYAGIPVIGAYTWLPDIGAGLVSEISQSSAFAPAGQLAWSIALIGIIVVLLMSLLIYVASRRIAGPILAITQTAVAVRGGDLTKEAPVRTRDEVGVLAETFNGMTAQLRENVETLERRVEERTAELATQKTYFEALVEISPAAVVTMDLRQHVTGWNPAATTLFGYTPEEALGRSIDELVLGSSEMKAEGAAIARASAERGRDDRVTRRMRKDGTLVDVEMVMVPLDVEGQQVGWYVVYHDITELERARQEANRANDAKSAFLATMSHEIRTPMNAIIGMSGLLADTELDDEQREYADIIRNSGEGLLTIINDVLDFSKIEAGRMDLEQAPFRLRECIEASMDLLGPLAARKGIELAYEMSPRTPEVVVGDVNRTRQILLNLLSNAVKFTDSGHVRLAADAVTAPDGACALTVDVTDTGIGISPEQVGRLFQSFSQADLSTSRRYGGTGLGLVISRRLAEMMGGGLDVESPGLDGQGSTFVLSIATRAVRAEADGAVEPGLQLEGRTALVVDGSALYRRILVGLLRGWSAQVVEATDVDRAVEILASRTVDVVVVDAHVGGGSLGVGLAHALEGRPAAPPIIVASASTRREILTDAAWPQGRPSGWVSKPVKPRSLLATVRTALGEEAEAVSPDRSDHETLVASTRSLRVLLAEDNTLNQKLAVTLLDRMGHVTTIANDGAEAVAAALSAEFDIILMDVQMPEVDGLEATRRIVSAMGSNRPRIVALTANAMSEDRDACLAAGMDDFLTKPLRREELALTLAEAAGRPPAGDGGPGTDETLP